MANFTAITYALTLATGSGGTTNPAPGTYSYPSGTRVSVAAVAQAGYEFAFWQDGGSLNPREVDMTQDISLTASFRPVIPPVGQRVLGITVIGQGTTTPPPGTYTVDDNDFVTVVATPAQGWRFVRWEGDVPGMNPVLSQRITRDMSLVAVFIPETAPAAEEALFVRVLRTLLLPFSTLSYIFFKGYILEKAPALAGAYQPQRQPLGPHFLSITIVNESGSPGSGVAAVLEIAGRDYLGQAITEQVPFNSQELANMAQGREISKATSHLFTQVASISLSTSQPGGWNFSAGML